MSSRRTRPTKGAPATWTWNQRGWLGERLRMTAHRILSLEGGLVIFSAWVFSKVALVHPTPSRDVLVVVALWNAFHVINLTSRWMIPRLAEKVVAWKTGATTAAPSVNP